jgi:predicted nucleic acid-binding protein
MLSILQEPEMPSAQAAQSGPCEDHGLADAAIAAVALTRQCTVLTDDLDLYLALSREDISVINFNHLREQEWGV